MLSGEGSFTHDDDDGRGASLLRALPIAKSVRGATGLNFPDETGNVAPGSERASAPPPPPLQANGMTLDSRPPLRVLHWIGSLSLGGEQRYLVRVANRLDPARFRQTIAYGWGDDIRDEVRPEVRCVRLLDRPRPSRLAESPMMLAFLKLAQDADLISTQSPGVWQLLASAIGKAKGVPVVHTIQRTTGLHCRTEDVIIRSRALRRAAYSLTDRFVGLSEYYKWDQATRWGIPDEKIALNYIGVDLQELRASQEIRDDARRELGYGEGDIVFGIIARQAAEKGIPRALRGFARIHARVPQARMLLVGDGPTRAENERLAGELGVAAEAHFAGARADATRLMQACDVVVQATRSPHNGIASIEAMALSKPIVTVVDNDEERRMAADTCVEGESGNGFLLATTDYEEGAARVAAALRDPGRLEAMGRTSRRMAEEKFDIDSHVERLAALYESLARQG